MKRPIFLTSFFSMKFNGSKFFTSAAIWQAYPVGSNCVIRVTPDCPASKLFQVSSLVLPTAQISPMPVTTTRLDKLLPAFRVRSDVVDRILHGADLLGVFIRDFDFKCFFERHDQLDGIE